MLSIVTLLWGTNWPLFKLATQEVSVWTFRAVAVVIAGLVLLAAARLRGQSLVLPRRHWGTVVGASVFNLVLWNIGSTYAAILIPSGQAAILGFTMPLWAALIGWLFLGQRLTPRLTMALALGAAAVALLMWRGLAAYAQAPLGFALGLGTGLSWALGTLVLKRNMPSVPALVLTGWQLLICAVPIVIGAFVLGEGPWFMPSWQSMAVIGYIALVPMAIGNYAWFSIVGLLPTTLAGLSTISVPMVAMVAGALLWREPLGPVQWLAMACSAAALWLALGSQQAPSPEPRQR